MRTRVYVDGCNLYYRALKRTSYRWLNVVELSRLLFPQEQGYTVDKVLYFTARVSGAIDPRAPARQQTYLNALSTLPEVEIHFGNFQAKSVRGPLVNLPIAGRQIATPQPVTLPVGNHRIAGQQPKVLAVYRSFATGPQIRPGAQRRNEVISAMHTMEEKGSDVNLAAHLLNDAWAGRFDAAVVISNDADLVTPIRMVTTERGKPVFIVCPGHGRAAGPLCQVGSRILHIRNSQLRAAQFPNPITRPPISKPAGW